MMRLLAQLVLSLAVVEMVPTSVPALESAHLPSSREETAVVREVSRLLSPELPIDRALRPPRNVDPESLGIVTSAISAMVVDKGSGQALFEKNISEVRPIGSLTKLISAAVFLETHPDLDAPAAVFKEDLRSGGRDHLYVDDEVRVRDLLLASLVGSDNPATMSLMRLSGLSPSVFVERMNAMAGEFGMERSRFVEPTGLDSRNVSTAWELVLLLRHVMEIPEIREATVKTTAEFTSAHRAYVIPTTNLLLGSYLNREPYSIVGGKTGFLPSAAYGLGIEVDDGEGHAVFTVVLGSESVSARFQEAKGLTEWAFDTYLWPDEE